MVSGNPTEKSTDPEKTGQQVMEALRGLRGLSRSLHATHDIDRILDLTLRESVLFVGAESGLITFCCSEGGTGVRRLRAGEQLAHGSETTSSDQVDDRVVFQRQAYFSNDTRQDPCIDPRRAEAAGVRSALSVPLIDSAEEIVGYLEVHNKKDPGGFSSMDREILITIAQSAAEAIVDAKAFRKIEQNSTQLEARVAERTAQLQDINEELNSFAYSVSHDLRAPLRAVQAFAGILLEQNDLATHPRYAEFLSRIEDAARLMDLFIQDLLHYSRLSSQEIPLHTVSLDLVVGEALQQLKLSGSGGTAPEFKLQRDGKLPSVKGDQAVLVQAILNLLSNAVKYVSPGVIPEIRIWAEEGHSVVRLYVQDNGIGIAPENQERIFKVFERLHGVDTYPGTGIGLAILRRGITRLGGQVGVVSRPGEGSRFWVELPAAVEGEDIR